jgi:hypothetical protein
VKGREYDIEANLDNQSKNYYPIYLPLYGLRRFKGSGREKTE